MLICKLMTNRVVHFVIIVCVIMPFSIFAQPVEAGKKAFQAKCVACHTIGKGKLTGPDLKDVSSRREKAWLVGFIQDPAKYLSSDETAKKLLLEYKIPMPALGVSKKEANSILAYIDFASGGAATKDEKTEEKQVADGNAEYGRNLFLGKVEMVNGGTACISCHSVAGVGDLGGGTLGPDLTLISKRYGENLGLTLKTLPFPTMKGIFDEKPLIQSEVNDLTAFFNSINASTEQKYQTNFILFGLGGFILLMLIFMVAWKGRLKDVRKNLVKGDK